MQRADITASAHRPALAWLPLGFRNGKANIRKSVVSLNDPDLWRSEPKVAIMAERVDQ